MNTLRLALAQINPIVGDVRKNASIITDAISKAIHSNADIVIFPEMSLSGYPPKDLLRNLHFLELIQQEMLRIIDTCRGITAVVGFPREDRYGLHNSAAIIHNGKIAAFSSKNHLSSNNYFNEASIFAIPPTDRRQPMFSLNGFNFMVAIGDDANANLLPRCYSNTDAIGLLNTEPVLLINPCARPYDSISCYEAQCKNAIKNACAAAFVNLAGGADELVFEGGSRIVSSTGELLASLPLFDEDMLIYDLTPQEASPVCQGYRPLFGMSYTSIVLPSHSEQKIKKPAHSRPAPAALSKTEAQYKALVVGLRDYMRKNGFKDAVLGLSGGVDSALCTVLAAEALGAEHVHCIFMPSCYSADMSREDSIKLCENLGIKMHTLPIEGPRHAFTELLSPMFAGLKPDLTEENLQARIRANILMALSNKFGWMVISTGNKSETACGYSTIYGDAAGGFSPIKDLYKTEVYKVCALINKDKEIIPDRILTRPPSAELRPDQKDSDSLPEYDLLDKILRCYLEEGMSLREICSCGYDEATVSRIIKLVERSEYKRRQAPLGTKLSPKLFGIDRNMPLTHGFRQ